MLVAAELPCDRQDAQPRGAASCDKGALLGVDPLIDRDFLDRLDHVLVCERHDRERRLFDGLIEILRHTRDDPACGHGVELHASAQEVVGVEISEHECCVRDRGLIAAASVAGGPRIGAGALRPDPQEASRIDPGDRPSARPDTPDIDRGHADDVAGPLPPEPRVPRKHQPSVPYQADIERRAARVADHDIVREPLHLGTRAARDRRHGRARLDAVNRPLRKRLDMHAAADGGAYEDFAPVAGRAQVPIHLAQMALHERLQRRVDRRRRSATVFADDGNELVRERIGNVRQVLLDQVRHRQLMDRVDVGPEKTHRDRFEALRLQPLENLGRARDIERDPDLCLGTDPFGHLERVAPRDVGLGIVDAEVVGVVLAAFAEHENVPETFGGDQGRLGDGVLDDRIGRPRGAVDQDGRLAEQLLEAHVQAGCGSLHRRPHAAENTIRRRQRLLRDKHARLVRDHDIGEGAARIHRDSVSHARSPGHRFGRALPIGRAL